MDKKHIFSFLIGVIITAVIMLLLLKPTKETDISELEGDVRGIYEKLVEVGYSEDLSDDDIDVIVQKVQEASNWVPKGTVTADTVLEGETFYNNSRDIQTGTYSCEDFEFLGNASVDDVLEGEEFYSNSDELLIGTLRLPVSTLVSYRGNASVSDVLTGKTFYSNSGTLKTGTYTPPTVSYLGDALVTDVMSGKKFYSNSGTLLTGTYTPPTPIDFTNMQYSTYDDYAGIDYLELGGTLTEDYQGEEAEWTEYTSGEDEVWKDERAGLYWSSDQTLTMLAQDPSITNTNTFSAMSLDTCDYFNSVPRSSYDGSDSDCGNAINWCATLDFGGRTDWYLPSQKELMLAYIDGMYNQAGDTLQEAAEFTVGEGYETHYGGYWSSSEVSYYSNTAWYVKLDYGYAGSDFKGNTFNGVRCVSRD